MKYFCMPSDFKFETIDRYRELNETHQDSKVVETYGQMAPDTFSCSISAGRELPPVDRDILERYIVYSKERDLEFNYVFSHTSISGDELTPEGYRRIKFFLKMLYEIGVDTVTTALPAVMQIASIDVPGLKVKASAACHIDSPLKAEFYDELGIKHLVLDENILRRFDILKNIRKVYNGELEITVNSFCSIDCPNRTSDCGMLSYPRTGERPFPYRSNWCRHWHSSAEGFMKLNFIRPEDLHYYTDIGISHLKIQGSFDVFEGDPVRAVSYYMDESYYGDLIFLLELFSPKRPLAIAGCSIDNRALDGFWEKFVSDPASCSKVCSECGYCKSFAEAAISNTDSILLDIMHAMDKYVLYEYPRCLE